MYKAEPDVATLLNGADILSRVGAHDEALAECQRALAREPDNLQAHLISAFSLDRLGRLSEAIGRYRSSLSHIEDRSLALEVKLTVADLERRMGEPDLAIQDCIAIAGEHGPTARASLVRALAHASCGEFEKAETSFQEAIALEPEQIVNHYSLGCFHLDNGRPDQALSAFENVAALDREQGSKSKLPVAYKIAQARMGLSDPEGALQALDESAHAARGFTRKHLPDDPAFGPLRGVPAFEALIADLVGGDSRRS